MAGKETMGRINFLTILTSLFLSTNVILKCEAETSSNSSPTISHTLENLTDAGHTTTVLIHASTTSVAPTTIDIDLGTTEDDSLVYISNSDLKTTMFLTPPRLNMVFQYSTYVVNVDCTSITADTKMVISTKDPGISILAGNTTLNLRSGVENCANLTINTKHLGRGRLYFKYISTEDAGTNIETVVKSNNTLPNFYDVVVIRMPTIIDMVFVPAIITLSVCTNTIMGTEVNIPTIKTIVKKPVGLLVAGFCQFVTMPMIAFAICKTIAMSGDVAIGLLLVGCAPGGGISNMLTFLIDGEVTLSISMTFFSTALAMGMMPLNTFIYGRWITDDDTYSAENIPYLKLVTTIMFLTLPVAFGMLVRQCLPNFTKKAMKVFKPFVAVTIFVVIGTGIYNGLYMFLLMTPTMILVSYLLPICGFITGGVGAILFKQRCSKVKTIAIEVGIQNGGVVATMARLAFEQPDADLAIVVPVCIMVMTSSLTLLIGLVHVLAKRLVPRYREVIRRDKLAMKKEGLMNEKQAKKFAEEEEQMTRECKGHMDASTVRFSQIIDFENAKESYI